VFFAYSGLNTRIGLVRGAALWGIALLVIVLASLGKGVACAHAARWSGESWRDAAVVGTLMNARGLMELILLNIGLEHGIITPTLFAVLVVMAIATTLATSPIYDRLVVPS
jgi:Kef-type K+ transport system membrane component KefB